MIKKLHKIYQKITLGRKFKHQYSCHPKFILNSSKDDCEVFWGKTFIAKIKKAHNGISAHHQSCYIVCSGPSIKKIDLRKIKNADLIAVNGSIHKFIAQKIIPTHIVIVDRRIFENQWSVVIESLNSGAKCYFSFDGLSQICSKNPELLIKHKNIYLLDSYVKKFNSPKMSLTELVNNNLNDAVHINEINPLSISFSENLSKGLFYGKTVAYTATQLAYCMGYKYVFILGMDMGGGATKYFYNTKISPTFEKYLNSHIIPAFKLANHIYTKNERGIFNLSAKSKLPSNVLPKISFVESIKLAKKKAL